MTNKLRDKITRERDLKESSSRVRSSRSRGSSTDSPITLLTDFGTTDYFVAAVKGVILTLNPAARIIDITHDIPPQDIEAAAFTLLAVYSSFPAGTIHVAVVDPGVGSSRRAILVQASQQYFIGPDNGIFSYICEHSKPRIFHLTNTKYFRHPVSPTFNGRDVFAPVAAALSNGVKPRELGAEIHDYVRLQSLQAETKRNGEIQGRIIHIDRFGNCITNITKNELTPEMIGGGAKLRVKGGAIKSFRNYFAEEIKSGSKIFAVWGSAGFLEIAAVGESAARILKAQRGDSVIILME
ncbi:MAG: SAM-dependent chlorinase/fluorinase [Acidobacteriota bacterium]|nr:SAM-dependent chlorinase/fluorinase [Acidobacteriota bacterium]